MLYRSYNRGKGEEHENEYSGFRMKGASGAPLPKSFCCGVRLEGINVLEGKYYPLAPVPAPRVLVLVAAAGVRVGGGLVVATVAVAAAVVAFAVAVAVVVVVVVVVVIIE